MNRVIVNRKWHAVRLLGESLTVLFLFLVFSGVVAMADEKQDGAVTDQVDSTDTPQPGGIKTLGGLQFWGDSAFFRGWRIQQNVVTGAYRLLDPADNRHTSGTREVCLEKLHQICSDRKLPPMSGKAVLLMHGLGRSSKCFSGMAKALKQDGYLVVGFDYPSTRVPIQQSAEYLHQVIQSLAGVDTIDVVCHSMGGLVLRSYLSKHEQPALRRVVMLGVPNNGAQLADFLCDNPVFKLLMGPAGQQLVTDKDGLISGLPVPKCEFGILAGGRGQERGYNPVLPGDNDMTVTIASARLAGAADFIRLPVIHSFLMTDASAIEATRHFLAHGRFDPDRPAEPVQEPGITVIE